MAKKLNVLLSGSASEVAKDIAIAAAQTAAPGLDKSKAEVIRDVNGKVVEVRITLPDSAATAAKDAISANNGVANVVVNDIIPGTVGFDGSLSSWNLLQAQGWGGTDINVTLTDNNDGTLDIASTDGVTYYSQNFNSPTTLPVPPAPNDITLEIKMALKTAPGGSPPIHLYRGGIIVDNGTYSAYLAALGEFGGAKSMVLGNLGNGWPLAAGDRLALGTVDEATHLWKVTINSTGLIEVFKDDVSQGTLQSTGSFSSNPIRSDFSGIASAWEIDFFRVTTI